MDTNPHSHEEKPALKVVGGTAARILELGNGEIARDGDFIFDRKSGMEGRLTFGINYWTVDWEDENDTLVVHTTDYILKKP